MEGSPPWREGEEEGSPPWREGDEEGSPPWRVGGGGRFIIMTELHLKSAFSFVVGFCVMLTKVHL